MLTRVSPAIAPPLLFGYFVTQVERAVQLGYDLRGIMYWTLIDNFEWGFGWTTRVRLLLPCYAAVLYGKLPLLSPPSSVFIDSPCLCGCCCTMQFGMYRWEDDGTQKRIPRPSIAVLKGWFARLPGRVAELMKERKKKGEKASGDVDVEEVEEEVGEEAMELAGVSK
jgi:hypothetical protein